MNFFKKLFGSGSKSENIPETVILTATINDKVMPIDRGMYYEDPIDEYLQAKQIGEIVGGGTFQEQSGELSQCDISMQINAADATEEIIQWIIDTLEKQGAPKGSVLKNENTQEERSFGKLEGLAIYLDGVNLPDEVYQTSDSNHVLSEIKRLTNDTSEALRHWQGPTETALYFYSDSFDQMNDAIQDFVNTYPLCKGARVVQIA